MKVSLKKRGQKFIRRFSRASVKVSEESREHVKEHLVDRVSHIKDIKLLIFEWGLLAFALIMLAISQAFWFGDSYTNDSFISGGTYTEATIGRINSMNPLFASTNSEKVVSKLLFATLVSVDYSGHPGLGLLSSIRASENGRIWTTHLKDNLVWSDGEPITNEDVLFTIELIQNPAVNTIYKSHLSGVKVTENENHDIIFTLPSAYADFASALDIPIVPKHKLENTSAKTLIEDEFSTSPVCSGAFMFKAVQASPKENESTYYLAANPNYYLGKPMLNTFAVHTYNTRDDVIDAINNGAVTATAEIIDSGQLNSNNFYRKESSINSGVYVFFNLSRNIVNNVDIRRSIRQGINLDSIRAEAPNTMALDLPFLKSQIELSSYPATVTQDYESAKTKITSLVGEDPNELTIVTVNSGYLPAVANKFREELEGLGLKASVATYAETQDFVVNVLAKRNYDILIYETPLGSDPDPLVYYHSSQATTSGLNLSNYKSSLVDDLLVAARETLDVNLRARKYESFLSYWSSDVPAIGLYQPNVIYYYNKNVRTYNNDVRLVTALDRFSDVTNWAATKGGKNKTP